MKKLSAAVLLYLGLATAALAQGNIVYPPPMAVTKSSTAVLASSLVVKASPGYLWSFNVSADVTLSGAAWWIMIFDATSLPADGTVTPAKCYALATGTTSFSAAFPQAVNFTTGIVVGVSTTGCFSKTASVHSYISADFQ